MISGQRYPFQAGYQQPKSQWVMPALGAAAAIGCTFVTGGVATVACLGLPVAMPYLYDWITRSGGRLNPETGQLERQQAGECSADCYFWRISTVVGQSQPPEQYYYRSETSACEAAGEIARGLSPRYQPPYTYPAGSGFCRAMLDGTTPTNFATLGRGSPRPADQSTWLPSSMDDIAPYMRNVNPDGRVWGEALERGAEFPQPDPTVTGPSQIQGPEKTTNNPDGSRTVERTTYNFQTSGNTITNTSNTTSSTTYNIDNSVRNSSSSTTAPTAEQADPEDPCEKRPNSIGCQELDEPPQSEIPKQERQITYAPESVLGGGSCPASRPLAYGREFSYAATCDALTTYVRPMVIAIAGWIAIVIIFGVGKPE